MDSSRFIADAMLGRLARRLRQMGYDTLYIRDAPDSELLRIARAEERVLITRDTELSRRKNPSGTLLLRANDTDGQTRELIASLGLPLEGGPPRCPACNGEVAECQRAEAEGLVPGHVFMSQERFYKCSGCGNVYWEGTQHAAMRRMLMSFMREEDS